jgi:hypothetical protein
LAGAFTRDVSATAVEARGSTPTVTQLTGVPANGQVFQTTTLTATTTLVGSGEPVSTGTVDFIQVASGQGGGDLICGQVPVSNAGEADCPFYFVSYPDVFLAEYDGVGNGSVDRYTIPAGSSATSPGDDTVDGRESDDPIRGRGGAGDDQVVKVDGDDAVARSCEQVS